MQASLDKLQREFDKLRTFSNAAALKNSRVSTSTVGWQIDHIMMVLDFAIDALAASERDKFKRTISWKKWVVFSTGRIPRGRARSPKRVTPVEKFDEVNFPKRWDSLAGKIASTSQLEPWRYFHHPIFGPLKRNDAIKFLFIHTRHHTAIIEDMLKTANQH